MEFLQILLDALPEAIGGVIAAATLGLGTYLYATIRKRKRSISKSPDRRRVEHAISAQELPETHGQQVAALFQVRPREKGRHNLPAPPGLIDRYTEAKAVCEGLLSRSSTVTIQGIGGVGKSALALTVAHLCLEQEEPSVKPKGLFISKSLTADSIQRISHPVFDAVIWIDLKYRRPSLDSILETISLVLGQSKLLRLATKHRQIEIVQLLQSMRCLIVADNWDDVDRSIQAFLLELPSSSKVIITTRRRHLLGGWMVNLEGLADKDTAEFVEVESRRLGLGGDLSFAPEISGALRDYTGGVPLAIKWILGHVKQRGYSLTTALNRLAQGTAELYEELFAESWRITADDAKGILFAIASFPGSCTLDAIAFASGAGKSRVLAAINQLTELSLIELVYIPSTDMVRYGCHPLTAYFVRSRAGYKEAQKYMIIRITDFYLAYLTKHGGYKNAKGFPNVQVELENVRGALNWCIDTSNWHMLISLVAQVSYFWAQRGHWGDYEYYVALCIKASEILEDEIAEANFKMRMSWLHRKRGRLDVAQRLVEEALETFQDAEDIAGVAWSMREMGAIIETRDEHVESTNWYSGSLELWQQLGRRDQISHLLKDLGVIYAKQSKFTIAIEYLHRSLAIEKERGDLLAIATRTLHLGEIAFFSGDYSQSELYLKEALLMHQQWENPVEQALAWWYLAQIEEQKGNPDEAWILCNKTHDIFTRLDLRDEPRIVEAISSFLERLQQRQGVKIV